MNYNSLDYRPLTKSEERTCLESAKNGNTKARNNLIMSIMPMVISLAHTMAKKCSVSVDDLIHEGVVGAYKAIDCFDLSFETRYSTFAMNNGKVLAEMQKAIGKSHLIGMPVEDRKNGYRYIYQSFDSPIGHDENSLYLSEVLPDENADCPADVNVINLQNVRIEDLIARLPESEDKIALQMSYHGYTAREIATERGYSRQTAINNRDRALKALKKILAEEGVL